MLQRNRMNQNQIKNQNVGQQLVHGLLDAERDYALKVNVLAEQWFAAALGKES
jgi:hypothetical protein